MADLHWASCPGVGHGGVDWPGSVRGYSFCLFFKRQNYLAGDPS